jgi:hypothetical protein
MPDSRQNGTDGFWPGSDTAGGLGRSPSAVSRPPGLGVPGSVSGRSRCPVSAFRGDAATRLFICNELVTHLWCARVLHWCRPRFRVRLAQRGMGFASAPDALAVGGCSMRVQVSCGFRRPDLDHHPGWDADNLGLLCCGPPDCAFSGLRAAARSVVTVPESGLGPSRGGYVVGHHR